MAVVVRQRAQPKYLLANCLAGDLLGDVVRVSGDLSGGLYQVTKINIVTANPELPLGLIVEKLAATKCVVQVGGEVSGVYTGLTPGGQLFVDLSSRLSHDVPTHPIAGVKWVYPAAQALSSNTLLLRIQLPTKLHA